MKHTSISAVGLAAATTLALSACTTPATTDPEPGLTVVTAVYPLQFVAERVAGDLATITPLVSPGVEPHDVELSPAAVRNLGAADLVLYIGEFQAAVDAAIATTGAHGLDVATVVALHDSDHDHEDEDEDEHEDEADDHDADEADHEDEDEHGHGDHDPHFWLDPLLLAEYAQAVGAELAALDPDHAQTYTANAAALVADLTEVDSAYTAGLAQCERREIVVSHAAFAYLAESYDLTQISVAGIDPDTEPSPARLREIRDLIAEHGATTIFTEDAVSATVVNALARDAGVQTAVLSPLETVASGEDYISVMTSNLATLRTALACG